MVMLLKCICSLLFAPFSLVLLPFTLDDIDEDYIYRPRAPRTTYGLPPPAETCCDCGQDFYAHQLCPECGYCFADCDCPPPFMIEPDDAENDCLFFLRDPDAAYDEWREIGGQL